MPSTFLPTEEQNLIYALCPGHVEKHASRECSFASEAVRRRSFADYPALLRHMAPSFAENGFFYTGIGDIVECYICHIQLRNWHGRHHNIDLNHKMFSSHCTQLTGLQMPQQDNIMINNFISEPRVLEHNENGDPVYIHLAVPVMRKQVTLPSDAPESQVPCLQCQDVEATVLLLPCLHLGLCRPCSLGCEVCPRCSSNIDVRLGIYRISPECMICRQVSDTCLLPCQHVSLCMTCASSRGNCPVCNRAITNRHRMVTSG